METSAQHDSRCSCSTSPMGDGGSAEINPQLKRDLGHV